MSTFINFSQEYSEGAAPFLKHKDEKEFEDYIMSLWASKPRGGVNAFVAK